MQNVHIGEIIKKEAKRQKIRNADFARMINTTPSNVTGIFKRPTIDTGLLVKISNVLNYNFFEEFTKQSEEKSIIVVDVQIAFSKEELQRYIKASETGEKIEFKGS